MANPNSPELKARQQQIGQEIEQLEQQIRDAEASGGDTTALKQQLADKEQEMKGVHGEQKDYREQIRQQGGQGQGQGRDNPGRAAAPGQQKKGRDQA